MQKNVNLEIMNGHQITDKVCLKLNLDQWDRITKTMTCPLHVRKEHCKTLLHLKLFRDIHTQ